MDNLKLAVVSVTKQGDDAANKLKEYLEVDIYSKSQTEGFNLGSLADKLMENYQGIIFITSTGIAVRAIAPFLKGKDKDPAVLVVDCSCKFVISLLSGHLGGANDLTLTVAKVLNAQPVITTATDNLGLTAPDIIAKENNLIIEDLKRAKTIAAMMVDGKKVAFIDEKRLIDIPKGYAENVEEAEGLVIVTNKTSTDYKMETLRLIRKDVVVGIGCRKDFDSEKMGMTTRNIFKEYNIDERAVEHISTVEIKKDEKAIIELAKELNCGMKVFSIEEIKKVQYKYQGSDFVEKTIGARAVCEPCVELAGGKLITEKISCDGMTICIGELKGVEQ